MPDPKHCANCDAALPQDANFCPACSQSTQSYQKPFLHFVRQSAHELLDIDGRLALTLKTLLFRPGLASYEFSQGKRAKYTPALRLYLVSSLLFFLVFASFQSIFTTGAGQHSSAVEVYSRTMFVLFPLYALLVKCFYWNSFYLANLVFSMHIHSVCYMVLMIIGPLEAVEGNNDVLVFVQAVPATYFVWYLVKAFKTMYPQPWWKTLLKSMGVFFVYMAALGVVFDYVLQ